MSAQKHLLLTTLSQPFSAPLANLLPIDFPPELIFTKVMMQGTTVCSKDPLLLLLLPLECEMANWAFLNIEGDLKDLCWREEASIPDKIEAKELIACSPFRRIMYPENILADKK